jgi:hypothetical protein
MLKENRTMKLYVPLTLALVLTATGCKQVSDANAPAGAGASSAAGFQNLKELDVISGNYTVKLTASGKLLAGGVEVGRAAKAPYAVSWDTTKAPDGVVEVELKAGTSTSKRRVVVLNNGAEVFFKNGSSGKIDVPPTGFEHKHMRYHFDMTDGVKRVVAVLNWDNPDFDLELSLGRGTCPHHGKQVAGVRSTRSPIVVHYTVPAGEDAPKGQWFAHVRLMNPDKVLSKKTSFAVKAFVLK